MKKNNDKKIIKKKDSLPEDKKNELDGLNQTFVNKEGKTIQLRSFLKEGDWWEQKSKKRITYIILHEAVKKIADEAGITTTPEYTLLLQPTVQNNYAYLIQVRITDHTGRQTIELGESSRLNLGSRGRNNPANMAQKRAYDRAVFRHLGIVGLLGEDELPDEDEPQEMDKISHEEKKAIVPLINDILLAKGKTELGLVKTKILKSKASYNEGQLDVLRGLFKKKLADLQKTF